VKSITNILDQEEEWLSEIEDKVEELLHIDRNKGKKPQRYRQYLYTDSNKEKRNMPESFKNSGT
jgi:hypothetical protein